MDDSHFDHTPPGKRSAEDFAPGGPAVSQADLVRGPMLTHPRSKEPVSHLTDPEFTDHHEATQPGDRPNRRRSGEVTITVH
jgi:hypothetical protein